MTQSNKDWKEAIRGWLEIRFEDKIYDEDIADVEQITRPLLSEERQKVLSEVEDVVIGESNNLFFDWRIYVNQFYASKAGGVVLRYPEWLEEKQRKALQALKDTSDHT